jgi:SRSO17 transposase
MEAAFAELAADLAPVYRRRDARANGLLYVRGLLMPQVAGNCWSIGEAVGLSRPYRLHHLLERAAWNEDAARDAVRAFLARHLSADGGVLIFDETGKAKKGAATDRRPAVLRHDGPGRERDCRGVHDLRDGPGPRPDRSGPVCAGISPAWATGDEVYGRSRELREFFEHRGIGYVFAVPVDHQVTTSGQVRIRADQALHLVEPGGWNHRSCGAGAKGPRYYDWAWITTDHPRRQLLIRRSITDPSEVAYFYAYAPENRVCSLTDLVKIAGARWKVEDDFQASKSTVGLDQTQVRL